MWCEVRDSVCISGIHSNPGCARTSSIALIASCSNDQLVTLPRFQPLTANVSIGDRVRVEPSRNRSNCFAHTVTHLQPTSAHHLPVRRDTEPTRRTPSARLASPTDSGRFFEGTRRLRLLTVLVTIDGQAPAYAGNTSASRIQWAALQREAADAEFRTSTYNKIGFDHAGSIVEEVSLSSVDVTGECTGTGLAVAWHVFFSFLGESASRVDAIYYHLPTLPDCQTKGIRGFCIVGALKNTNPFGSTYVFDRGTRTWGRGCMSVMHPVAGSNGDHGVFAHEFGHYLGLNHAGGDPLAAYGRLDQPRANVFEEYGDTSAVMGVDVHHHNSFTAPARYYLGVLPDSAVSRQTDGLVRLRALTQASNSSRDGVFSALALSCATCASHQDFEASALVGKELWLSYRGNADTCHGHGGFDDLLPASRCHRDYSHRHNRVHVHFRFNQAIDQGPWTEEWYWMSAGDVRRLETHTVRVCATDVASNIAHVAIGASSTSTAEMCATGPPTRPPHAPTPPLPPQAVAVQRKITITIRVDAIDMNAVVEALRQSLSTFFQVNEVDVKHVTRLVLPPHQAIQGSDVVFIITLPVLRSDAINTLTPEHLSSSLNVTNVTIGEITDHAVFASPSIPPAAPPPPDLPSGPPSEPPSEPPGARTLSFVYVALVCLVGSALLVVLLVINFVDAGLNTRWRRVSSAVFTNDRRYPPIFLPVEEAEEVRT